METTKRRLEIMKLLCRQRYATMPQLAREFNVSVRTIQRDIFELTFLIPIYVKNGRYDGGVYVDKSFNMDRIYMNNEETALLNKIKALVDKELKTDERIMFEKIINNYTRPQ